MPRRGDGWIACLEVIDKAAALRQMAANGRKVWECFMLGVDPTKANDDFKITRFWMEGGKPTFRFFTVEVELQ